MDLPASDLDPKALDSAPELSFMIEELPSRNSSSLIVQHRLGSETQIPAVLKLVEEYLPKFDIYNCATALHKCGLSARDDDLTARQIQSDPNFIRLFSTAKKQMLSQVNELDASTLTTMLWACARLSIYDSELTTAIAADATSRMNHYSPHSIGLLMFSLGYSGVRPRPSLQKALLTELQGRSDFDTESLLLVVYACMRLGIRDRRIMEVAGQHILETGLSDCEPLTVASFCYCYGKLEYWERNVLALLAQRSLELVEDLSPRMLVMTLLGLSSAVGQMEELDETLEKMKVVVEDRMQSLSHRDLSTLAFAFGKYSLLARERQEMVMSQENIKRKKSALDFNAIEAEPFIKALKDEVIRRDHDTFTMQELNLLVYALMRMEHRDQEFLSVCAQRFEENAAELMLVEILNILYAFGKLDYLPLSLVETLLEKIHRRDEWDQMDPAAWSVLSYSLALNQVRYEKLMDRIAVHFCEHVREYSDQSISMLLWGLAFLNCRNHGEVVASTCLEEIARRGEFSNTSLAICFYAAAILGGKAAALPAMNVMMMEGFWRRDFTVASYAQIYSMLACWQAELGLPVEELVGHTVCRSCYEDTTSRYMGEQHRRLSDRLRIQRIPHEANAMAPALDTVGEAGVRADIVIPKLRLVIEVEGPQRSTIPMELLTEKLREEDQALLEGDGKKPAEIRKTVIAGERSDVLVQAREYVECGLSGAAAFKRRLLRSCGWRVVTVSFNESEEYIADALKRMINKDPSEASDSDADEASGEMDIGVTEAMEPGPFDSVPESMFVEKPDESMISEFESKLRAAHDLAQKKVKLRLMEEREDFAASAAYSEHLQYRQWQVSVEKEVLAEMIDGLKQEKVIP